MDLGIEGFRNLGPSEIEKIKAFHGVKIKNYCKQLDLRVLPKILLKIPLGGELSDFLRDHQR